MNGKHLLSEKRKMENKTHIQQYATKPPAATGREKMRRDEAKEKKHWWNALRIVGPVYVLHEP